MKVRIKRISDREEEQVVIECVTVTREIDEIRSYILTRETALTGTSEEKVYQFPLEDVFYFEAVDERVFAYTRNRVYEMKVRLYEVEESYAGQYFVRCSKSAVINLMKLECISPALNGRFRAHMKNGEELMISRQYVPAVKQMVFGNKDKKRKEGVGSR